MAVADRTDDAIDFLPSEGAAVHARDRAFRSASRHSRRVRVLKIGLPVLAVTIAALFFAWSYTATTMQIPVSAEGAAFSDGKLVMANPKLEGVTKDNLPYSMKALRAVQEIGRESMIELEGIDARLPMDAGNWATVTAPKGLYDRDKNTLDMLGEIKVVTTDGVEANLKSVSIEIGKGNLSTTDPVAISRAGSRISSDRMKIAENGRVLVFEQRVRVHIDPSGLKKSDEGDGEPNAGN